METLNIHFAATGSWGVMGRSFCLNLARYCSVRLINPPLGDQEASTEFKAFMAACPPVDAAATTLNVGDWRISASLPGRRIISYIAWETTYIPEPCLSIMRTLPEIWVPSQWQRRVFIRNGLHRDKVRVIPLGYDPTLFYPAREARPLPGRPFRFLFVGKWEKRKGVPELLDAFTREFDPEEPVELMLAAHNPFLPDFDLSHALTHELTSRRALQARISLIGRSSETGLADLYRECDAFVLPTRAEGWGLPLLEAMACGLPCIVTNYSGVTEFTTAETAYLLRRRLWLQSVNDPIFYNPILKWGHWARPSIPHLRRLMRAVVCRREAARAKGLVAADRVRQQWTWDHSARKIVALLGQPPATSPSEMSPSEMSQAFSIRKSK